MCKKYRNYEKWYGKKSNGEHKQGLDEYDAKFADKLQNSLESIDEQTVKIIKDLKEFKELSK